MIKVQLGQEIKKLRIARGYSQESFSKVCSINRTYIAGIESGKRNISIENIEKIAKGLNVTLSELFQFGTPTQRTIILNVNGVNFLLESDSELTSEIKDHIEAICGTFYDEDNEWNEKIYDMSVYEIAELFEKEVNNEVGIRVNFRAVDLEVSITED